MIFMEEEFRSKSTISIGRLIESIKESGVYYKNSNNADVEKVIEFDFGKTVPYEITNMRQNSMDVMIGYRIIGSKRTHDELSDHMSAPKFLQQLEKSLDGVNHGCEGQAFIISPKSMIYVGNECDYTNTGILGIYSTQRKIIIVTTHIPDQNISKGE